MNKEANDTIADFMRRRIKELVHDPATADLLAPTDHPFFTKRPPLETNYYVTFNRENVTLRDVRSAPIEEITASGVRTTDGEYEVDAIVFATGFDTMTGTLFRMGIRGRNGVTLSTVGRRAATYLGLTRTASQHVMIPAAEPSCCPHAGGIEQKSYSSRV